MRWEKVRIKTLFPFTLVFALFFFFSGCNNPFIEKILQPKTIVFDSNGGSAIKSQTVLKGEKISQPSAPVKANFIFKGWYADNNDFLDKWDFDTVPTTDMTLYAGWTSGHDEPITNTDDLKSFLQGQPDNTPDSPYIIKLNVDDLAGIAEILKNEPNKYVYIDLSGITFNSIEKETFINCTSLTSITIPASVTSIGINAFASCTSLTSVKFEGTIPSSGFDVYAFNGLGDLRDVYFGTGTTGGPGTYITTPPVNENSKWKKI